MTGTQDCTLGAREASDHEDVQASPAREACDQESVQEPPGRGYRAEERDNERPGPYDCYDNVAVHYAERDHTKLGTAELL